MNEDVGEVGPDSSRAGHLQQARPAHKIINVYMLMLLIYSLYYPSMPSSRENARSFPTLCRTDLDQPTLTGPLGLECVPTLLMSSLLGDFVCLIMRLKV